jgi:primosomal protein N' (replication factor Y) (superfamily II helicase)
MIAEIVFPVPLFKTFYYSIPSYIKEENVLCGQRARAPFGFRFAVGLIVALHKDEDVDLSGFNKLKAITSLLDEKPLFGDDFVSLILWLAKKCNAPLGLVFSSFYIPVKNLKESEIFEPEAEPSNTPIKKEECNKSVVQNKNKKKNSSSRKKAMEDNLDENIKRILYPSQKAAIEKINSYIAGNQNKTMLLYGPPKSGKTEVYARAIEAVLENEGQVLYLLPDIHLINPVLKELEKKFPNEIIDLWHSKITQKKRLISWKRIITGRAKIIIGTRSAVFLPFKSLALIIMDEEQDDMYKQEEVEPHFHARDIILKRAQFYKSCVILGSSCPSIESFNSALSGDMELIELKPEIKASLKPHIEIIDSKMYPAKIISDPLLDKIKKRFENKEQVLLIINRKGYSYSVNCAKCGWKKYCPKCGSPMTVRKDAKTGEKIFFCWRCSTKAQIPDKCPKCFKNIFRQKGVGTQKLEDEMIALFPKAKIVRIDGSTTIKKSIANKKERPDIIIGTRIAARGHKFPKMALVAVLNPEIDASPSDFRSSEKLFQMLLEASGRISANVSNGDFIIQTNDPEHYVFPAFINSDYRSFVDEEIKMREKFSYPPFASMARVLIYGNTSKEIEKKLEFIIEALESDEEYKPKDIELLGPLGVSKSKIRKVISGYLIIRAKKEEDVLFAANKIRALKIHKAFKLKIFVSPYNFR